MENIIFYYIIFIAMGDRCLLYSIVRRLRCRPDEYSTHYDNEGDI